MNSPESSRAGLERIADHASHIAEDVIYFTEGRIVRHKRNGARPRSASGGTA